MKNTALLFVVLFLIFPKMVWGDGGNFQDYINSSGGSSGGSVNKDLGASHPAHHEDGKDPDRSEKTDAGPALQGVPAQWQRCAVDSDCSAAVVDCVSWDGINKQYLHKLAKDLRSCTASIDPGFQPQAVCVDKECRTTDKSTDVSWEEWLDEMHKRREQ